MKKIFLLFAALAIVFANVEVRAICPAPYPECIGPNQGQITFNGCIYDYEFCMCINQMGLHEVALSNVYVQPPCQPSDFENNKTAITDAMLLNIAASGILDSLWNFQIPECPNDLCLVRWRDAICYSRWEYFPPSTPGSPYGWRMVKCDNITRSCGETIRICWEIVDGRRVLKIFRAGSMYPSCPTPPGNCKNNCGQ